MGEASTRSGGEQMTGSGATASGGRLRLIGLTALAVVALDAVSKALAVHYLSGRGRVEVLGGAFHLELYRNFAGPGNSFQNHTVLISLFALFAVVGMAAVATQVRSTAAAVALGLLLGGGIGNLLDRLLRAPAPLHGGVVDWLKPTLSGGSMNLADLAINLAFVVLLLGVLIGWWRDRRDDGRLGAGAALRR